MGNLNEGFNFFFGYVSNRSSALSALDWVIYSGHCWHSKLDISCHLWAFLIKCKRFPSDIRPYLTWSSTQCDEMASSRIHARTLYTPASSMILAFPSHPVWPLVQRNQSKQVQVGPAGKGRASRLSSFHRFTQDQAPCPLYIFEWDYALPRGKELRTLSCTHHELHWKLVFSGLWQNF